MGLVIHRSMCNRQVVGRLSEGSLRKFGNLSWPWHENITVSIPAKQSELAPIINQQLQITNTTATNHNLPAYLPTYLPTYPPPWLPTNQRLPHVPLHVLLPDQGRTSDRRLAAMPGGKTTALIAWDITIITHNNGNNGNNNGVMIE